MAEPHESSEPLSPMQALIRELLARKEAQRAAAIRAVVEQCDEHWREVARWAIEEYERQLHALGQGQRDD